MTLRMSTITLLLTAWVLAVPSADAKGQSNGKGKGWAASTQLEAVDGEALEQAGEMKKEQLKKQKRQKVQSGLKAGGTGADELEAEGQKKLKKEKKQLKGLDKQRVEKAAQVQKEAGKGSEQGQTMRKENRRKWWKFGFGKDEADVVPK